VRSVYLDHPLPLLMAHRGYSERGLENSMAAFQAAVDLGVTHLETDVHATADARVVAFHDRVLDRVTDSRGTVCELGWDTVRTARIGGTEPVPLLEDLIGAWPNICLNIDVKAAGVVGPLVDVLNRTRCWDRVCIASFSDVRRRAVQRRLPAVVASSPGQGTVAAFWALTRGHQPTRVMGHLTRDVVCLQVPERYLGLQVVDQRFVDVAHRAGLQVHVWTVNDPLDMARLLELGVDGLITDRPDTALDVVRRRGLQGP